MTDSAAPGPVAPPPPLPAAQPAAQPVHCLNCGEPFGPRRPSFCPACGQESHVRPPRLGEFLQQFGGAYFATEGALWRTLKLLLFKPGELTRLYLAGRRKHYVLPLRLYLSISIVMLLVLRVMGSANVVQLDLRPNERGVRNFTVLALGEDGRGIGMKDGVFYCNSVPQWICKRVQRRLSADPGALKREIEDFGERFLANTGGAMFLLLPSFALWLKLAYWNRRLHYTEHLVFALHVHAFGFMAIALMLTDIPWLVGLGQAAVVAHTLLAMRRVYGGRWWPRLLRAALVGLLYCVVLVLALVVVALWSALF